MTRAAFLRICFAQIAAGNTAWVAGLRDQALAKIAAGQGSLGFLVSGSLNGKTLQLAPTLTALEVADVTLEALAEADGDNFASTALDFSQIWS